MQNKIRRRNRTAAHAVVALVAALVVALGAANVHAQARSGTALPGTQPWGNYIGAALGNPDFGEIGLKVFGGQQLHPNFGWEAALTNFSRETIRTPGGDDESEFWGVSGAAVGILPLPNRFAVFGKLGLMFGRERVRRSGVRRTDSELNPLFGIGGSYHITPEIGVRIEFEEFGQGNLLSAGVTYRF
jgi:hypothetical protein